MLFNSHIFIFLFLPVTLIGFLALGSQERYRLAILWLVGASLFFYGWWNPVYLWLVLGSMLFNYAVGIVLGNHAGSFTKKAFLSIGVIVNLGLIGYFKYANFFVGNVNALLGTDIYLGTIVLPLAISFFTFQQIAYLVDAYRGETREHDFFQYCLFVTFFPQLIAGPIVHHREMLPQFAEKKIFRLNYENISIGLTIFTIGLFKKVVIADGLSIPANAVFAAAEMGTELTFFEAWGGALAYTFQLYFDFSGYSDMAIGLARLFGIILPLNFNSPYKASNIIDFWRRWHITLSRFLRDYLYVPLGGSRNGKTRRYLNVMVTMLLGGLWHGASWSFVVWGGLHGLYLVINQAWRALRRRLGYSRKTPSWIGQRAAWAITFLAVVIGWVFFRAKSFDGALTVLSAMAGSNGISLPRAFATGLGDMSGWLAAYGFDYRGMFRNGLASWQDALMLLLVASSVAFLAPNTQQLLIRYRPAFETYRDEITKYRNGWLEWSPSVRYGIATALLLLYALGDLTDELEFLYYQF